MSRPPGERLRLGLAVAAAAVWGTTLVLLLGRPAIGSDQGVFLSVAARMLDGDALYSEVVDNKDPLFFFVHAGALLVGGWRGPSLLDGVWFGLAALGFGAMLRALGAPRIAVVVGFLVYPLALAGGWYFTGLSMLGALALVPWAVWLWLRGRHAAAGAVVAATLLLKLNLGLVAVAPLAALLFGDRIAAPRARQAVLATAGAAATLAAAALALALQGSLRAYLETISYNLYYANALIDSDSPLTRIRAHLSVVSQHFTTAGSWQAPAAIAVVLALALVGAVALRRGDRALRLLVALALATLGAGLATLGSTAYYTHHLQLLALPAALAAAAFVTAAAQWWGSRWAAALATACVVFATWSAAKHDWPPTVSQWSAAPVSIGARELEHARERYFASDDTVPYVVFGTNGEDAHAAFIDDSFDLACRWFHLYRFSTAEQFAETLECFERERPPLVLVTFGFHDDYPGATEWQAFVEAVRERLAAEYTRVSADPSGFEVWRRRESA